MTQCSDKIRYAKAQQALGVAVKGKEGEDE